MTDIEPIGGIDQARLNALIDSVAADNPVIKTAVKTAGYPAERLRPHGFTTLLKVIASQQLSVKAAATISGRLIGQMDGQATPDKLLNLTDDELRAAGLSRPKMVYVRSLAEAVAGGDLPLQELADMEDEAVVEALTQVKGLGRWSAEMYLISSLGREDIWPVDDLGVQEGVARFLGLEERPKPKQLAELGEPWRPARSAMAIFAWHYYAKVPI